MSAIHLQTISLKSQTGMQTIFLVIQTGIQFRGNRLQTDAKPYPEFKTSVSTTAV